MISKLSIICLLLGMVLVAGCTSSNHLVRPQLTKEIKVLIINETLSRDTWGVIKSLEELKEFDEEYKKINVSFG